jgi:hypothetical protein
MLNDQGDCAYDLIQFRPCISIFRLSFRHIKDALIMSITDCRLIDYIQ